VADALAPERSVARREAEGGTGPAALRAQLDAAQAALAPRREAARGNALEQRVG
jgi:hypothetical protein